MRGISAYLLIFILFFQLVPLGIAANPADEIENVQDIILYTEEFDTEIILYSDQNGQERIAEIPNDTAAKLVEINEEYSFIQYVNEVDETKNPEEVEGYVHNNFIVDLEYTKLFEIKFSEIEVEEDSETVKNNNIVDQEKTSDNIASSEDNKTLMNAIPQISHIGNSVNMTGIALSQSVSVYADMSREAIILKEYKKGHILKYRSNTEEWHIATVYIDGKPWIGYIHAKDVETATASQSTLQGIGTKSPTPIYVTASTDSRILKTYNYGHILKYKTFTSDWYEATVFISGKARKGYIHAKDVETAIASQSTLQGIGTKNPTPIYATASTDSRILKTYNYGHILKYKTYTSGWYEATVFINGKAHTGYIHANDVETVTASPTTLQGAGAKNPTRVYETVSTGSRILKTYNYGHTLKYRTFTSDWYQATVYINGKAHTGYIHKNDVVSMETALIGYGHANPTTVYSDTSKGSTNLKSYPAGSTLKYRPHSNGWFQATVMYNGKWSTGYIHADDVVPNKPVISGYGHANPTTVYSKTSKSSTKLKSYQLGAILKYRPYNKDWYEATVMYNGNWTTGYIHADDVALTKPILNTADKLKTVGNNNQLILVTSNGYNTSKAKIETYERDSKGRLIRKLSISGHIGKNGFATNKVEGDGKSPVGKYSLGTAFGQEGDPGTKLPFRSITSDDVWIDDPNSKLYNSWQSRSKTSGQWNSAENMNHRLYKYGFVINYNMNPVVRNKGSAILFHVGNGYTVGCTATSEANVISIMKWVDPKKNPVIIQTPEAGLGNY